MGTRGELDFKIAPGGRRAATKTGRRGSGYFCGGRVVYRLSLWGWGWALGALQLEADFLTKSFIVFQVI